MRLHAALALAATVLAAQEPRFDVQSRLVLVPVTVTDATGRTVEDLQPAEFLLLDEAIPRKTAVDSFATGVAPIALTVAVQSSGISAAALEKINKIGTMIQAMITGERGCAALLTFARQIEWRQECTGDPSLLSDAFARLIPANEQKDARMLDAAMEAIERLRARPNVRRILLLISESRDRSSETELSPVLEAAQWAGVTVYAFTYSAFKTAWTTRSSAIGSPRSPKRPQKPSDETGTRSGGPEKCGPWGCPDPKMPSADQRVDLLGALDELRRLGRVKTTEALADSTGGAVIPFTRQKELEAAIEKLGLELHTQYVLSFTPEAGAPAYRRLEVRIKRPGEFSVRSRPGYWAPQ